MRVTSKGQVTIPQEIREEAGLLPSTEVEFKITKAGILIKKVKGRTAFGKRLTEHMRGRSDMRMTTDEIMALTRG
ncbi:MAG TPA: AbrB/MazE/SpoVT family DNA-binding domain-containing protein [Myxococcota bacterium]|nr:AbrB/MazE/SpoVT family DNA-binding domain-containing protein [Myxococcota bacterium]